MSPDARRRTRPSLGSAVELRLREIRRGQPQVLVRPPQLDVLAFELLEPRAFVRRQPGPLAAVTLGLPHPAPQRLGRTPDLLGDRGDRRPLRRVFLGVLEHHPHRSLAHLRGKPARSRHDPILSRDGASDKPGAVHRRLWASLALVGSNFLGNSWVESGWWPHSVSAKSRALSRPTWSPRAGGP